MIRQGEIYWVDFAGRRGSRPAGKRPVVVLQCDAINRTAISTVVVAAITSNLKYRSLPTSVELSRREAGLPKRCLVNLTLIRTLGRKDLGKRIGRLGEARLLEIKAGLSVLFEMEGAMR